MTIKVRLDNSFGPAGVTAGMVLVIAGLIMLFSSWFGLILLIIGAFVGFSHTGTLIDPEKHRMKFTNFIFGFIPAGKWLSFEPSMRIGIKETSAVWSTYSTGNRKLDTSLHDFRIALYDADLHEIVEIEKYKSLEAARSGLLSYEALTGLSHI